MGNLSGSFSSYTGNAATEFFNLTTPTRFDWIQFPQSPTSPNRKLGGGSTIGLPTAIGPGTKSLLGFNGSYGLTWTDGTPTTSATKSEDGTYLSPATPTIGQGIQIVLPADTDTRTLEVYWGSYSSAIKMVATLSDGSAADYTETHVTGGTGVSTYFRSTLVYTANSAGQTLTLQMTVTALSGGQGNTWLMGAAYTKSTNPSGTLGSTLGAATMAATGALSGGAAGTMAQTLANAVSNGWTGTVGVAGTMGATLGAATSASTATEVFTGFPSLLLADEVMAGAGGQTHSGSMAQTLAATVFAGGGGNPTAGALTAALQNALVNGAGAVTNSGTMAPTLQGVTFAGAGGKEISGALATTLAPAASAMPTQEIFSGSLPIALGIAQTSVVAKLIYSGTFAVTLQGATFAGLGQFYVPGGFMAVTLQNFVMNTQGQNVEPTNVFEMGYWITSHRRTHEL